MTLFAGSRNLGVDISSFMGDTQPYDEMGAQAVAEDAKNIGLSFGLGAEIHNAGTTAGSEAMNAQAKGEAMTSAADSAAGAQVAGAGMRAAGGILGGLLSGGGMGAVSSSPFAAPAQTAFGSYFRGMS